MGEQERNEIENVVGVLRLIIKRGINLAVRDLRTSDPYVTVSFAKQKVKTRTVENSLNPEWNEELTICVTKENQYEPIVLNVYDDDMIFDDEMGYTEVNMKQFIESVNKKVEGKADGTIITEVRPCRQNCLSEKSEIIWMNGKVTQNMYLRLLNVECGEIELQMEWTEAHGWWRA